MKKTPFPAVIVVEGATDKALIASFLECEIVTVNGSAVPRETLEYLREASKTRTIVILTDPDYPGKRIRDTVANYVPLAKHAFIPKEKAIKRHKVGVAESDRDTIMQALGNLVPASKAEVSDLLYSDLLELGLVGPDSRMRREWLEKKLHLGYGNGKTLLNRLKACGYTKEQIKEALNGSE